MNMIVTAFGLGLALGSGLLLQTGQQAAQGRGAIVACRRPRCSSCPSCRLTPHERAVQITQGPVVENVTDTTAEIAWSTNVNSGTALHYGTDPSHLDLTAGMPWGGLTHRVLIKNLKPNTTYYFKAESGQGQGTGTMAEAAQASFQTKPAGPDAQAK